MRAWARAAQPCAKFSSASTAAWNLTAAKSASARPARRVWKTRPWRYSPRASALSVRDAVARRTSDQGREARDDRQACHAHGDPLCDVVPSIGICFPLSAVCPVVLVVSSRSDETVDAPVATSNPSQGRVGTTALAGPERFTVSESPNQFAHAPLGGPVGQAPEPRLDVVLHVGWVRRLGETTGDRGV